VSSGVPSDASEIAEGLARTRMLTERGEYVKALAVAQSTHDRALRTLAAKDPVQLVSIINLGTLYKMVWQYPASERLFSDVLGVLEEDPAVVPDPHLFPRCLSNFGELCVAMGRRTEAERVQRRALAMFEKLGGDPGGLATCLINLGSLCGDLGRWEEAEGLLARALSLEQRRLGEHHPACAIIWGKLGGLSLQQGKASVAQERFENAVALGAGRPHTTHPDNAEALAAFAHFSWIKGDLARARSQFADALAVLRMTVGSKHPRVAHMLEKLALLSLEEGQTHVAQRMCEDALEILSSAVPGDHLARLEVTMSLARIAHVSRRPLEGERLYRSVLEGSAPAGPDRALIRAHCLNELAILYREQGRLGEAEPLYRESLAIARSKADERGQAALIESLALLCAIDGRPAEARECLREAAAIQDRLIVEFFGASSEAERLASIETWRRPLNLFISLARHSGGAEATREAFEWWLSRKALTYRMYLASTLERSSASPESRAAKQHRLSALRAQVADAALALEHAEGSGVHQAQQRLTLLKRERDALEARLARGAMPVPEQLRPLGLELIAACLPRDAALVDFARVECPTEGRVAGHKATAGCVRYFAFVLIAGGSREPRLIDLGDADEIDALVAELAQSIEARRTTYSSALRERIFDPLRPLLGERVRVILSPDGELWRIPFEVLPDDASGYLIDEFRFSYVLSGRDVLRFGRPTGPSSPAVVVFDPDFDATVQPEVDGRASNPGVKDMSVKFGRLSGSRTEGEYVQTCIDAIPLSGEAAKKTTLMELYSPRILHFATHGFFVERTDSGQRRDLRRLVVGPSSDHGGIPGRRLIAREESMLRSGLALAGANTARTEGVLLAAEAALLDLSQTALVMLATCRSGHGDIFAGEGVMGLARGFMLAGARTVIATQWQIPDAEAARLGMDFYKCMNEGHACADALRSAQCRLRAEGLAPFYWGAFVCLGDPGAA
jgi:CHAT domain-containing protein/tetratricopeptide (TPR) repeat protein